MNYEAGYRKIRNILIVFWAVRNIDYLIKKIPFAQPWLEKLEASSVGQYVTSAVEVLLENERIQEWWNKIYGFFGVQAFVLIAILIAGKFIIGKMREADFFLQVYKIFSSVKLTTECSCVQRMKIGKGRYIRVVNSMKKTDKIIPIEAEKETKYEGIKFYKKKGKVHMEKPDGQKIYLERDVWKQCNIENKEMWIKLV